MIKNTNNLKFGFIKPAIDAHTLGVNTVAEGLRDSDYEVIIASSAIETLMNDYKNKEKRQQIIDWLLEKEIDNLGISYRLDPEDGINMVSLLVNDLKEKKLFGFEGAKISMVFYAGLPQACEAINQEFKGLIKTFSGGEPLGETLLELGVEKERIPKNILEVHPYDNFLLDFGKEIINSGEYLNYEAQDKASYPEYGSKKDTVNSRIDSNIHDNFEPLMRAHVGPYSSVQSREASVQEFIDWIKSLSKSSYLDVLSIGSSQLTQSNFNEDWTGMTNAGGVPVQTPEEYKRIWEASRPLLVRTYAGTKNIPELAKIHEDTLNISWHALSIWWFNTLDGRGPYDVYTNLKQHVETLKVIAKSGKPFEANVSHHFAFRGASDTSYVVSAFLAAKLAKKMGIKTFILQNMLNTPRMTWGIQDLAKSRAMIKLIRALEDENFKVYLQPRAGLDYLKSDAKEAKIQLAAVSALMDDIEPNTITSPEIVHVVSYSEGSFLATPDVINESIQITQESLKTYRKMKKDGSIDNGLQDTDLDKRVSDLYDESVKLIQAIEEHIENPYSAQGFYKVFAAGYLPVPYLWNDSNEYKYAKDWKTKFINGGVKAIDEDGNQLSIDQVIEKARKNLNFIDILD